MLGKAERGQPKAKRMVIIKVMDALLEDLKGQVGADNLVESLFMWLRKVDTDLMVHQINKQAITYGTSI